MIFLSAISPHRFGIDEAAAKQAVTQALPGLLGGMAVDASSEEGATQLTSALKKHEGAKFKGLDAVDTEDGKKIVKHVLGDKEQDVALALGRRVRVGWETSFKSFCPYSHLS